MILARSPGLHLAACCLAMWFAIGTAGAESEQGNHSDFEKLRGYLGAMTDLSAEFSQQVMGPGDEILEQASGSVVLSKPGRFRWNYREPYERVIVADGERIWFYEADLEQVTIRRMATGLGDTPAALLTGDASALEQFQLLESWTADGFEWLQLEPVSAEADFSTVDIGFADGELQKLEFTDRLGQRTKISLSEIVRSPLLTGNEFLFVIPAGVDVIGEDDM